MNKSIVFEIKGNPKALKRHRVVRHGSHLASYDPSKKDKEVFAMRCKRHAPEEPFDFPVGIDIQFWLKRPKTHYRTGKYSDRIKRTAPYFHIIRPDIDNLVKFVADALTGLFWVDDSIICDLNIVKRYAEEPRTHIFIYEITK